MLMSGRAGPNNLSLPKVQTASKLGKPSCHEEGHCDDLTVDLQDQGLTSEASSKGALQRYPKARSMQLSFNSISTLHGWKPNCLRELVITSNKLESCLCMHMFAQLEVLDMSRNVLQRLDGLSNLPKLRQLKVRANRITSLSGLGRLTSVTFLDASCNQLGNLSGLTACTALCELSANSNKLTSLKGLHRCGSLRELQVGTGHTQAFKILMELLVCVWLTTKP